MCAFGSKHAWFGAMQGGDLFKNSPNLSVRTAIRAINAAGSDLVLKLVPWICTYLAGGVWSAVGRWLLSLFHPQPVFVHSA